MAYTLGRLERMREVHLKELVILALWPGRIAACEEISSFSMIVLHGTPIHPGAAIGAGVRLGKLGLQSVPERLLKEAAHALKQGLPEQDFPQVIFLCNDLSMYAGLRIPGLKIAGFAAEKPAVAVAVDVPAVAGVGEGLVGAEEFEGIVIIDGTHGTVYLDPDAPTVQKYEILLERRREERRYFLGAEHMPAKTMDGRIVSVAAMLSPGDSFADAIAQGADELLFTHPGGVALPMVLSACGGKPVTLITDDPAPETIREALWHAAPGQVGFALSAERYGLLRERLSTRIEEALADLSDDALEPAEIRVGCIAKEPTPVPEGAEFLIVWAKKPGPERPLDWSLALPKRVILIVGEDLEAMQAPVEAGIDTVAVAPGLVCEAKDLIRTLPRGFIV